MNTARRFRSCARLAVLALLSGLAAPALAIVGATPTTSFEAVGRGVQVAPDWVLTVYHYAYNVGDIYNNGYGDRVVAARYDAPGSGTFPANDFSLLRLVPLATSTAPYLVVNDALMPDGSFPAQVVTLASAANSGPARGYASTTITESDVTYDPDDSGPLAPVVVNWLISMDTNVYVQSGDSGSAMFAGTVQDSGLLLGLASALLTDDQNNPVGSAYVQPGAYKSWIDATMAADTADNESIVWLSAVPEPGTLALWAAGMGLLGARCCRRKPAAR